MVRRRKYIQLYLLRPLNTASEKQFFPQDLKMLHSILYCECTTAIVIRGQMNIWLHFSTIFNSIHSFLISYNLQLIIRFEIIREVIPIKLGKFDRQFYWRHIICHCTFQIMCEVDLWNRRYEIDNFYVDQFICRTFYMTPWNVMIITILTRRK